MADNSKEQLKRRVALERRLKQRQASRPQISDSDLPSPEDPSETETETETETEAEAEAAKLKKKPKIQEKDITGLKYFDKLAPMLERLHRDGCKRDKANNRTLHYDQYCMLLLLYLFNPIVTSMRGIGQASELKKVQKKLGCQRASLGSLSEATSVFEAERLKEIIAELGDQLQPLAQDKRLSDIQQTITLVDGSLIAALPNIMEAPLRKAADGNGIRINPHTSRHRVR